MKRYLPVLFLLFCCKPGSAIDENELPFGSYGLSGVNIIEHIPELRDTLGFNIFWDSFDYKTMEEMADSGITAIKQGTTVLDSLYILSYYNYAKIEAEEQESNVRMYNCGGEFDYEDGLWISHEGSGDKLFGPNGMNPLCWGWAGPPQKYFIELPQKHKGISSDIIDYTLELSIKIDEVRAPGNTVVATLWLVCERWCEARDTLFIDELTLNDFVGHDDELITLTRDFVLPETVMCCNYDPQVCEDSVSLYEELACIGAGCSWATAIIIETTGIREVSVDYLKIYDRVGRDMVDRGLYDNAIIANAKKYSSLGDGLWGWYMQDEPLFTSIATIGYIADVIRNTASIDWRLITAAHRNWLYDYWFEAGNEEIIVPDIYPFLSGRNDSVTFTGFDPRPNINQDISRYMQNRMIYFAKSCSLAYHAASDNNAEFWIIPQCFQGVNGFKWRYPTNAELACQVYIALASGARGVIFWKYGFTKGGRFAVSGLLNYDYGRHNLWYAVSEQINPYIKAIDSTLLQLTLERSYMYKAGFYAPPDGAFISSISTTVHPDSVNLNPDSGWYHVGEFAGPDDARYVMIVNRACSRGPDDPAPAPSVTATVDFKTINLRIGNHVDIIDLATNTSLSDWTGTPDTAQVESIRGKITYSTGFESGEGRLFKLVRTP